MNRRVLFVDDEAPVLESVARLLRRDFEVTVARDAGEALAACRSRGPFAVVMCDYGMPGGSGVELLARLRHEAADSSRVLITGRPDLDVAVEALHRGDIFRFLAKPFTRETLVTALDEAVERYRLLDSERRLNEQLRFAREALITFTEALEARVDEQVRSLHRLHEFASRLNGALDASDIGRLTAASASDLLHGRAVVVELSADGFDAGERVVRVGPDLEEPTHSEPIVTAEGAIGSIRVALYAPNGRRLAATDRNVLSSIAHSAGVALQNQVRRRERDDAQHALIFALARLAEKRDDETGKHLERVSAYCALVAEGLREDGRYGEAISDEFVADLVRSAPLHDIGKVGIPDSILLKPGRLDADEWAIMQTHTQIGADTIRAIIEDKGSQGFLTMGLDIAWCHHEKWDGSGYPRGLAGAAIPLAARIVALADCYDALTTQRPYKQSWPHDRAVAYLREKSGTQFDPAVVASFVARERRADRIRDELADEVVAAV